MDEKGIIKEAKDQAFNELMGYSGHTRFRCPMDCRNHNCRYCKEFEIHRTAQLVAEKARQQGARNIIETIYKLWLEYEGPSAYWFHNFITFIAGGEPNVDWEENYGHKFEELKKEVE